MKEEGKTKRIALTGLFVAAAFVLSYVESLIPIQIGIPGVKLGLSNLAVIVCMYCCSAKETFFVAVMRIILAGLTFGSLMTIAYSLSGGILSLLVMYLLKHCRCFSVYGVSISGGVSHNAGQLLMAVVLLQTEKLLYYLPFLIVSGMAAGTAIGILGAHLISRLKNSINV